MKIHNPYQRLHSGLDALFNVDTMGVPAAQVDAALNRAQMRTLPLVYGSIGLFYLAYALLQLLFLREPGMAQMVGVALVSGAFLLGLARFIKNGSFPAKLAEPLAAVPALLVLLSIQLRFYLTADPKQAANVALFVFAMAVLFFDTRWFLLMAALALAGLLHTLALYAEPQDWRYYLVVFLAAAATGLVAHVGRVRAYRRTEALRIRELAQRQELEKRNRQVQQFNQRLEANVAERTQELQAAYARLAQIDQTKTDFITIASHEMLTPLTIINLNAQMFLDEEMILADKTYMGWVEGIDKGVTRMREVVETMLDVARIDNQALKLHLTPVALPQFIQQVANQFRDSLVARQLTLTVTPMPDLAAVAADAEALAKVFHHLLVNAIKYTPDGGEIVINGRSALLNVNGARQDGVEITITDTGIGIAPEVQELIFEKFYQTGAVKLHSSGKTKFKGGGFGLGLAIARGIVLAHHGQIWVESAGHDEETHPGSRFHILLPYQQPD